jgi:glycosyltransferase involved in cell wall biosynthesis
VGETVQSGATGILVEPTEPPANLAAALLRLIEQPQERIKMAEEARSYALSQSWDAIMSGLRERYQRVIDERATELSVSPARG